MSNIQAEGAFTEISAQARRLLLLASVGDRVPTPILDIAASSQLVVAQGITLSAEHEAFLASSTTLQSAIRKTLGLVDLKENVIYLNTDVSAQKQAFITLHECGHKVLPWQRDTYLYIDNDTTLSPDINTLFEREANYFAAEVMFQIDRFEREAHDFSLGVHAVLSLSKRYRASVHATFRRYVERHRWPCAVVICSQSSQCLNTPTFPTIRYTILSPTFAARFTVTDLRRAVSLQLSAMAVEVSQNRVATNATVVLQDRADAPVTCCVEGFDSRWDVFFLVYLPGYQM